MSRRARTQPLAGTSARDVERLLGVEADSLISVELKQTSTGSHYALKFDQAQRFGGAWRRTLRIPAKRVRGYEQRSPRVRPSDVRYRAEQNRRRFWFWLLFALPIDAPIVAAAADDPRVIDEFRAAILVLADANADDQSLERWLAA